MRALPPPRRSRSRRLRKLLSRLYYLLTFRWLFKRRRQIIIKKRRTPFHLSARKYKVKIPRKDRPAGRCDRVLHPFRRKVVTTQVLNNMAAQNSPSEQEQSLSNFKVRIHRHKFRHRLAQKFTTTLVSQIT